MKNDINSFTEGFDVNILRSRCYDLEYVTTRYLGSKRKLVNWILGNLEDLHYTSVLDAFGGTASVSYEFKKRRKNVTYNDILRFNYFTGLALIQNSSCRLTMEDMDIISKQKGVRYPTFIQDTFKDIYYTDQENAWLDVVITNITRIANPYKHALAMHALVQSCIAKRPYNLFHRRNLYMRLADVNRSFSNKNYWERSFESLFREFAFEANNRVFSNGMINRAWNLDVLNIEETDFDLVYLDPPYVSEGGEGTDYLQLYNFVEGLCYYQSWHKRIDYESKNLSLKPKRNPWVLKETIIQSFERLFQKFKDSMLAISYRSPGIPSELALKSLLEKYKADVTVFRRRHKYALSKCNGNYEILIVAR